MPRRRLTLVERGSSAVDIGADLLTSAVSMIRKGLGLRVCALTLATAAMSCSSGTGPLPAQQHPGHALKQTASTGTLEGFVFLYNDPQLLPPEVASPSAGSRFIGINVQISNIDGRPHPFSFKSDLYLMDAGQHRYDPISAPGLVNVPDSDILPQRHLRGIAVFDVPRKARRLSLHIKESDSATVAVLSLPTP